jgi:hypothetical protein
MEIQHTSEQTDQILGLIRQLSQMGNLPQWGITRDSLMKMLGMLGPLPERPGLYWDARHPTQGGTQRVTTSPGAPSADHYRLVDSLEEAETIFGRGEKPLLIGNLHDLDPDTLDPGVLRQLQEDQWAAPNGIPLFSDQGINFHSPLADPGRDEPLQTMGLPPQNPL